MTKNLPPKLIVISGPSGVGKGTLCAKLLEELSDTLSISISATSRAPRPGEVEGVDYYFKTRQAFEAMIAQNEFLEWAEYSGNYYGTPYAGITARLEEGKSVLLEVDVQGAKQVREKFKDACLVFIQPPSMEILAERLRGRNNNSDEEIKDRLAIASEEMKSVQEFFDFTVINDDLSTCLNRVKSIVDAWLTPV